MGRTRNLLCTRRAARAVGVAAAAVSLACVIAGGPALASTTVRKLTLVPDDPLATTTACKALVQQQVANGSVNFNDGEVEPFVAVDPTNSQRLIGAFQQDRWNDGGSNGLTTAVSSNGGKSWTLAAQQPLFSTCAGAPAG